MNLPVQIQKGSGAAGRWMVGFSGATLSALKKHTHVQANQVVSSAQQFAAALAVDLIEVL